MKNLEFYDIIEYPIITEKTVNLISAYNRITFVVHKTATKMQIKAAIEKMYSVKVKKINIDTKFFIIDRKELLFYLSKNTDDEDIAIWLNSEFFAQAFASLFEKALKN